MIYSDIMNDWCKKCEVINTNYLIALCEIGEVYKSFCADLAQLVRSNRYECIVQEISAIMQGRTFIHLGKYKSFAQKYKQITQIINKYDCLDDLAVVVCNIKSGDEGDLTNFYQYFQEHKENTDIIKEVALKIKKLGFNNIQFCENLDFTKIEFQFVDSYLSYFCFLENLEIVPTFLNDPIKYKTSDSCYCITGVCTNGYDNKNEISSFDREIFFNSLIFEPNRLLDKITVESTIGVIRKLSEDNKTEVDALRDSICLNVSIGDLKKQFECLKLVIKKLDEVRDNEELMVLLNQMQSIIGKIQTFGENYEDQTVDSNERITNKIMKEEKRLYLERRGLSDIDTC